MTTSPVKRIDHSFIWNSMASRLYDRYTECPGYYLTEMTAELSGTPLEQALVQRTPSGHLGETGDLVGTCLYLVSSASDHVTGVCIPVDGGYLVSDGMPRG